MDEIEELKSKLELKERHLQFIKDWFIDEQMLKDYSDVLRFSDEEFDRWINEIDKIKEKNLSVNQWTDEFFSYRDSVSKFMLLVRN